MTQQTTPALAEETRWLDADEQRAWRAMQQLGGPLASVLNRQLVRDSGLSSSDYEVLVVLSEATEPVRAGDLGRQTGWEKSRLSHHIKRMEARGLVRRQDCETDARGSFVVLTPTGRAAIEGAAPGHVHAVRRYVIDLLTPAQLAVLAEVGETVGAHLRGDLEAACHDAAQEDPDHVHAG